MMTEQALSKLVGVARKATGMLTGYPGIFSTLQKEHGEVSVLLGQMDRVKPEKRRELFALIRAELLAHANAEQATFYAALARDPETTASVADAVFQHQDMQELISELTLGDAESRAWLARFHELADAVRSHVEEEENELFPEAKDALTAEQVADVDRAFKAEKLAQLQRLDATVTASKGETL